MKVRTYTNIIARLLVSFFLVGVLTQSAFAYQFGDPLSGDVALGCGTLETGPCQVTDIPNFFKNIIIAGVFLVAFCILVALIFAIGKYTASTTSEGIEGAKKIFQQKALLFVVLLLLVGGGFLAIYGALVKPEYSAILRQWFPPVSISIPQIFGVTTLYAADQEHLPNPLVVESLYDVVVIIYQLAMRWILIPYLIASWIYAGFLFVQAQGDPAKLATARTKLWRSFVGTIILMFLLGFAYAIRDTINQILA